ncbi:protein STICHEL-like isoform X2 [Canna indica]|uniref:Protein STICHEL-like isoform X2 n=1 Tax=Canna indica TaxID=4628 RepID=A0AAQ3KXV5_9LILI|nr:protein STICHEL-like isoform X2 [Canna indica]
MKVDDTTFKVQPPMQAIKVLRDHPRHHLLKSEEVKRLGLCSCHLDSNASLKLGKLYFLVELPRRNCVNFFKIEDSFLVIGSFKAFPSPLALPFVLCLLNAGLNLVIAVFLWFDAPFSVTLQSFCLDAEPISRPVVKGEVHCHKVLTMKKNLAGEINLGSSFNVLSRGSNGRKILPQYNWRHHSTKSIERLEKLDDEDREAPVKESSESNFSLKNSHVMDSKSDICLEIPIRMYNFPKTNSRYPVRRAIRKYRRRSFLRREMINHSAALKLLDTTSSSLGDSDDQSDDSKDYNSEDLQQLAHKLIQKDSHSSRSASSTFHGSRCGSQLYSSNIPITSRGVGSSQSCTPVSTSSYYKYGAQELSTDGSWDDSSSFSGGGLDQPELSKAHRCGIPCYWSKRTKGRRVRIFNSPSLSDTLKSKGSKIFCGSQTLYTKKKLPCFHKQNYLERSPQGFPLLVNNDIGHSSLDTTSGKLSSKFEELDLEAISCLDGKRWSSCKIQEGLQIDTPGTTDLKITDQITLSQKYQPRSFNEIVGQNIVVQSLGNAIKRGRIAPAYLFHGPSGTGKTSAARIFAASLNCLSSAVKKPCWCCRECIFSTKNGPYLKEVNATYKANIDQVRYLLKTLSLAKTISQYKVLVIDECHMLSSRSWLFFMKFLEESLPCVVIIFITTDPGSLPRAIISRCQKFIFSRVKDVDIVNRLRKLSINENLDVESDALNLIALNSEGSLRDAETMLDQLSLLGKRITPSVVNDLVGVVPSKKLHDLLEKAMSSDTAETIKMSRELINSGVDPITLMSQLAGHIMDVIAGTYQLTDPDDDCIALRRRSLTEVELEKFHLALKILSDAEKQLRHSSERSIWFTAALLQLGWGHKLLPNQSSSTNRQNAKKPSNDVPDINQTSSVGNNGSFDRVLIDSHQTDDAISNGVFKSISPEYLDKIWRLCINRCHSNALRQLLSHNGRLLSVVENKGSTMVVFIGFEDSIVRSRAERFLRSITNSMEIVLGQSVDVRIELIPKVYSGGLQSELLSNKLEKDKQREVISNNISHLTVGKINENRILHSCKGNLERGHEKCGKFASGNMEYLETNEPMLLPGRKHGSCNNEDKEAAPNDLTLETTMLRASENGYIEQTKSDKNQVLQNGLNHQCSKQTLSETNKSFTHWDDELNREFKALMIIATENCQKEQIDRVNHNVGSPSILHCNGKTENCDKECMGYESGPVCNGLLCWKTNKNHGRKVPNLLTNDVHELNLHALLHQNSSRSRTLIKKKVINIINPEEVPMKELTDEYSKEKTRAHIGCNIWGRW